MTPRRDSEITPSTFLTMTVGQWCAVVVFVIAAAGILISFTVWLNTMHEDIGHLKTDSAETKATVHETNERVLDLSRWLMPEHIPTTKQAKIP